MIARDELQRRVLHCFAVCASALAVACADRPGEALEEAPVSAPTADSAPAVDSVGGGPESPPAPSGISGEEDIRAARSILEAYYAAIREGEFERAYLLWADSGRASGQTPAAFREGYAGTLSVEIAIGQGSLEGAAGSRYADFPVGINATTRNGAAQRFEGNYVLRRAVVDGASADQRAWRIYSADIRPTD